MPRAIPAGAITAAANMLAWWKNWPPIGPKSVSWTKMTTPSPNPAPHPGDHANLAVYLSPVTPGETVLGLDLAHGGHLTHGMKLNSSGILYHFVSYGVTRETHDIDFDQVRALARD